MSKKFIKEEILNAAKRLFNRRGYDNVSMRDIAQVLDISVGNLTYHYPRKEDILLAVAQDVAHYYDPLPTPGTLPQLNAFFAQMQNNAQQNAFYFWHTSQPGQMAPEVQDILAGMAQDQYDRLLAAFESLQAAGLMLPEARRGQRRQLAQALQLVCVYWVPYTRLRPAQTPPPDLLDCLWAVLLPNLTEAGKSAYLEKVLKVRVDYDQLD